MGPCLKASISASLSLAWPADDASSWLVLREVLRLLACRQVIAYNLQYEFVGTIEKLGEEVNSVQVTCGWIACYGQQRGACCPIMVLSSSRLHLEVAQQGLEARHLKGDMVAFKQGLSCSIKQLM